MTTPTTPALAGLEDALADVRMSAEKRERIHTLLRAALAEAVAAHDPATAEARVEARCAASYVVGYREGVREARRRASDIASRVQADIAGALHDIDDAAYDAAKVLEAASGITATRSITAKHVLADALDAIDARNTKETT